jgi:hypothetical protein
MYNKNLSEASGVSENLYKVSIQGEGISIERDAPAAILPRLLALLIGDSSGSPTPDGHAAPRSEAKTSIAEFLTELNISSNPERIAGIALFVREILGRDRVARDELPEWFQRAGQPAPRNLIRDVKNAVAQRLITEDHARAGEYLVTESGIRAVRGPRSENSAPASRPRSAKKALTGRLSKKNASSSADGPMAKIQELIDEDWFASPHAVSELLHELAARGTHYKTGNVTLQMQTLVKDKKLRRQKRLSDSGKREVWYYSNW